MKKILLLCLLAGAAVGLTAAETRVLVYTRNFTKDGKGYVHDNIATGVALLQRLGAEHGFKVDVSNQADVFTDANLKNYRALIFANSNNEAFENDVQRAAFERYIQQGGGFVGIHSATGSERTWPYYWLVIGAKFNRHPPLQPFTIDVVDPRHPAAAHLGATWQWEDEFYYHDHLNPRMHVILAGHHAKLNDPKRTEYPGATFGEVFPLAWCIEENGGRRFYTALGHKIQYYAEPKFQQHVLGGILWVLRLKD